MPPHSQCYPYAMDNCHDAPHSQSSPKIARPPLPTKIIFDGTNPRIEPRRPKTTTYGRKCPFQPDSINQKCATFNPTFAPEHASPPGERSSRPARRVRAPVPPLVPCRHLVARLLHRG